LKYLPGTIAFLGYDWRPAPRNFGETVRRKRTAAGMSTRKLARELNVDAGTIESVEGGQSIRSIRVKKAVEEWLGAAPSQVAVELSFVDWQ
jgi:ribosome-binding protein aMBF1 (putative translation factor)